MCNLKDVRKVPSILLVVSKEEGPLGIKERVEVWRRFG
jgi:hypothetical protein